MLAVIVLVEGRERKAATGKFFGSFGPFFRENADFKKLFGTLLLFIGYIFVVEEVGFTVTSIILYSSSMYFIQVGVKRHFERVL